MGFIWFHGLLLGAMYYVKKKKYLVARPMLVGTLRQGTPNNQATTECVGILAYFKATKGNQFVLEVFVI